MKNKYRVAKAILFIGYLPENKKLYQVLKEAGFEIIFKPTVESKNLGIKGNIDAELVLHAAKVELENYDKSVFVSGDGDFHCLYENFEKERRLYKMLIPNKNSESSLLKRFNKYKDFLYRKREELERI